MSSINNYSYLFNTAASSPSTNMYKFFAGANQYTTLAKYAIAKQYGKNSSSSTQQVTNKDTQDAAAQKKKNEAFLSDYENTYKSLTTANTNLKKALSDDTSAEDTATAVKDYVNAYNKTVNFLSDNSSTSTSTMNILKTSLVNAVSSSKNLSSLGISQNANGTITLDEKMLSSALSTNGSSAKSSLSSLSSLTNISTKMGNAAPTTTLVKEQNKVTDSLTKPTNNVTDVNAAYQKMMSNNNLLMRNYYFTVAQTGLFVNVGI